MDQHHRLAAKKVTIRQQAAACIEQLLFLDRMGVSGVCRTCQKAGHSLCMVVGVDQERANSRQF